jgi:hypothetical protein
MFGDDQSVNSSAIAALAGHKSNVWWSLSAIYVVGIAGTFLALLHLHQKANVKNTKQAFMLK